MGGKKKPLEVVKISAAVEEHESGFMFLVKRKGILRKVLRLATWTKVVELQRISRQEKDRVFFFLPTMRHYK